MSHFLSFTLSSALCYSLKIENFGMRENKIFCPYVCFSVSSISKEVEIRGCRHNHILRYTCIYKQPMLKKEGEGERGLAPQCLWPWKKLYWENMSSISRFIIIYITEHIVVMYYIKNWIKFFRNEIGFLLHFEILNFTCSHSFSIVITLAAIPYFWIGIAILNTIDVFHRWCKLKFGPLQGQVKSHYFIERIDARRQYFYFLY